MTTPLCPICKGRKHTVKDGIATRCKCILQRILSNKLTEAGVPLLYHAMSLNQLGARIPNPTKQTKKFLAWFDNPNHGNDDRPLAAVITGNPADTYRMELVAYFVRSTIEAGRSAAYFRTSEFIDAAFNRVLKPAIYSRLTDSVFAVVDFDAPHHKYLPEVAEDLYARRMHLPYPTLFVSADDIPNSSGKYGPRFAELFKTVPTL